MKQEKIFMTSQFSITEIGDAPLPVPSITPLLRSISCHVKLRLLFFSYLPRNFCSSSFVYQSVT